MRANYIKYRDCICVDSTYRTNKYQLFLVNFVGISNTGHLRPFGDENFFSNVFNVQIY